MMIIGKHRIKNHMTMEYNFAGIRILGSSLIPVDWKLSVQLTAFDKKGKSRDDLELAAAIAYQRIYFWLETNLPNTIMVDVSDEDDLYIANLSSNIMLYCPSSPYDDVIAQLLHSKIAVLAGEDLLLGALTLKGSDVTIHYEFDSSETGYMLPTTTEEYYTEGKARDILPWWMRPDGFSFEFIRPDDASISDEELYKDIIDPMDEFESVIQETSDKFIGAVREPAKIVQIEKWKPRKV